MVPRPFRTGDSTFQSSITMDSSTVGNTTVTVAVHLQRTQAPAVLESIYRYGESIGFKPFYHKSNDFEFEDRSQMCDSLIREHFPSIHAFSHTYRDKSTRQTLQIEALHSAIWVDELLSNLEDNPLIIVDGNEQQVKPFLAALNELREELPSTAHCQKSEQYYPGALLADLSANHLAHQIQRDQINRSKIRDASHSHSEQWGKANYGLRANSVEYTPAPLANQRGATVKQRINCWYNGSMMTGNDAVTPATDSLHPLSNKLKEAGFDILASQLSQL